MAERTSNIFAILVRNAVNAALMTIPMQTLTEGAASQTIDLSPYFTAGIPSTIEATPTPFVTLYNNSGGTNPTDSGDALFGIVTVTITSSIQEMTIDPSSVNITSDSTVYAQITFEQTDP